MTPSPPPFPEAELRALLASRVAAWAAADEASAGDEPRRVYVDAFAGAELQFGSGVAREAHEPTRAATALETLDAACAGTAPRALFVEEDPAHLQRIYVELEDVAGERLRATRDYASLAPGEASLVEAPFVAVADDIARWIGNVRAFVFLAPATARALPWTVLRSLLALPDATVLVRFPSTDFEKQSRHVAPVADLPGFARRIVEGCSAFLGDERHTWLPAWRAAAPDGHAPAMVGVLERFAALLRSAAGARDVQPLELASADGARTWLFLVTADVGVAEAITDALVDASPSCDDGAAVDRDGDDDSAEDSRSDHVEDTTAKEGAKPRGRGRLATSEPAAEATPADEIAAVIEPAVAEPIEPASGDPKGGKTKNGTAKGGKAKEGKAKRGKVSSADAESSEARAVKPQPAPSPEVLDLFPDQFVEEAAPKQRAPRTPRRESASADVGLISFSLDDEGVTEDPTVPRDPAADG